MVPAMARARTAYCRENHPNRRRYPNDSRCVECRREDNLRVRAEKREYVAAHKLALGCFRCGYARVPSALHMHHRDPGEKEMNVAEAAYMGWARIRAEIAKCVVLCANCHAELHAEERAAAVPSGTTETVHP